ncbi:hypothetical protein [Altererythrobacter fulvus]|uniref:hypothetical protein n=1 Tax=Caenibius fulvus TaxID=2126012 RepID=UPI003015C660
MKQLAGIYERKGTLFVQAEHKTKAGFWIADEQVVSLRDPTNEALGQTIAEALRRSQSDIPTPPPTARLDEPLLHAAEVASWSTFMNGTRHVSVLRDDTSLSVTSYRNLGRKEGFEPGADLLLEYDLSATALGQIVSDLIGRRA